MIGWINQSVKVFVVSTFGQEAWEKIVAIDPDTFGKQWVSSCPFPDSETYNLVFAAAKSLGVTPAQALEAYGVFFVKFVKDQGYDKLMSCLGSNLAEFLGNLNNLHLHLSTTYPAMVAPRFKAEDITPTSMLLHYYSGRPGLCPITIGVLKGLCNHYWDGLDLQVEVVRSRDDGTDDHEVLRLTYPYQDTIHGASWLCGQDVPNAAASTAFTYVPTSSEFGDLFPFHMLLDQDCKIIQMGRVLSRLLPELQHGTSPAGHFRLLHPMLEEWSFERLAGEAHSSILVKQRPDGVTAAASVALLELQGQIVPTRVLMHPGTGCPVTAPALLLLLAPRVAGLDEMTARKLFLSDLPLHGQGREFVLLAEQRLAEAGLKERYEKLSGELSAANDCLARAYAQLETASALLEAEKRKGDALLYQMLPEGVANALRAGKSAPASTHAEVTILFSDIVGFTNIAALCSPMEICRLLDSLYKEFDEHMGLYPALYKVETIGDSYMVVANITMLCNDHVDQLLNFAIGMHHAAARVHDKQGQPLKIRVGLHTGPVVAGVVGARMPRFCLFGDTVNTASRMESHGLPGMIHISASAYNRIVDKSAFAIRPRGTIEVKGKGAMTTYLIGLPETFTAMAAAVQADRDEISLCGRAPSFSVVARAHSLVSSTLPLAADRCSIEQERDQLQVAAASGSAVMSPRPSFSLDYTGTPRASFEAVSLGISSSPPKGVLLPAPPPGSQPSAEALSMPVKMPTPTRTQQLRTGSVSQLRLASGLTVMGTIIEGRESAGTVSKDIALASGITDGDFSPFTTTARELPGKPGLPVEGSRAASSVPRLRNVDGSFLPFALPLPLEDSACGGLVHLSVGDSEEPGSLELATKTCLGSPIDVNRKIDGGSTS